MPESVRSSVRTGIILLDVTRVVEELVYNSLDAGASKVYSLIVYHIILFYGESWCFVFSLEGNVKVLLLIINVNLISSSGIY